MRCWRQFLHLYGSQSSTVWCSDRGLCFLQLLLLVKKSSMQLICTLVVNELPGNWCGREITIIMTVAVTLRHDLMSFDGKKKIVKLFNKLFYDFFARTIQKVQAFDSFGIYMICVESDWLITLCKHNLFYANMKLREVFKVLQMMESLGICSSTKQIKLYMLITNV